MLEINKKFQINSSIVLKNFNNKIFFMLDSDSGKQYNLTEMEYFIVYGLSQGMTVGEIFDYICVNYDVKKNVATEDLQEYISSLVDEKIIY